MEMVGQNADRDCFERIPILNGRIDTTQMIDMLYQEIARPIGKCNGEEKYSAFDLGTTVPCHNGIISPTSPCRTVDAWAKAR